MKMSLQGVLNNKYVLYVVAALAVVNVVGYLSIGSMECLGVFAITALVCQQYCKNMTMCLLGALFVANVVFGCGRIKENFESATESMHGKNKEGDHEGDHEDDHEDDHEEGYDNSDGY